MGSNRRNNHRIVSPSSKNSEKSWKNWIKRNGNWDGMVGLLTDPRKLVYLAGLFVILEVILNIFVIETVGYTEIDWKTYMQQVKSFLNGTMDYGKLRGDTGPLVYPAGFVYIYSLLHYLTSDGTNIKLAQYIFAMFYITLLVLVLRLYARTKSVPPYALILIFCTSYRIHSIFILRLFNDPIAMIFLFAAINAFLDDRWYLGSILYSLAVSVKMNILLFSPALLVAYVVNLGLTKTIVHLGTCATVQLILGIPFLVANPYSYVKGAFDFGRVFEFQWTVNWRFLPETVFVATYFHALLLVLHLATLFYFVPSWIVYLRSYAKLKCLDADIKGQLRPDQKVDVSTMSRLFVLPLFAANFIGIAFSRSLHYQFYIWYYHTLPYLAWHSDYTNTTRIVILGVIELCWNTYPSTIYSSAALHLCHLALLYGLNTNRVKSTKVQCD